MKLFKTDDIKYTTNQGFVKINNSGENTGYDLIMPFLTFEVWNDIVEKNQLYQDKTNLDLYLSRKYPETKLYVDMPNGTINFVGRLFVSTYIQLDLASGYDVIIRNRSGNFNKNINIVNGLIDNPYTGRIGMQINTISNIMSELKFSGHINGDKSYAQIVLRKIRYFNFKKIRSEFFKDLKSVIDKSNIRGENGFGSSGK